MIKLELENIEYQWNEEDEYKEHRFASLKKVTTYKGNKKYQSVTVRLTDIEKFKEFLKNIVETKKDEEVPF